MIRDIHTGEPKYYDFAPQNKSFLLTALELKELGIKNYYFCLEVKNPKSGVTEINPWNPNITAREIEVLMLELRANLWFWSRTVTLLRTTKGIVPLELNRGLAASYWCFLKHLDSLLCQPRQTYKTTGLIGGPIQWSFQLASNNGRIKFFGKDNTNTKNNIGHLADDIDLLPEWLQFKKYQDPHMVGKVKKAGRATETITNGLFGNKATITSKANSDSTALQIARGESAETMYFDEVEFTLYFGKILANSAPAFKTTSDNAKSVGNPTCRLLSSTPTADVIKVGGYTAMYGTNPLLIAGTHLEPK